MFICVYTELAVWGIRNCDSKSKGRERFSISYIYDDFYEIKIGWTLNLFHLIKASWIIYWIALSFKTKSHSIIVRWNDAPIGHFLANYDQKLSFEYTIDISPGPATELGLKSVLYKKDDETLNGKTCKACWWEFIVIIPFIFRCQ